MNGGSDIYEELRDRLRATQSAAERIAASVPPQGWAAHGEEQQPNVDEIEALLGALRSLRELLPEELQEQLRETIRQVLMLVRGILDLVLDRLETTGTPVTAGGPPADAEDIPIL